MARRACLTTVACVAFAVLGTGTATAGGHGGKIYFADEGPHLGTSIFSVSPNGRHRDRLTKAAHIESGSGSPAVSPNGRKIAFERFRFRPGSFDGAIWTMRADGSHQKRLTSKHGDANDPSFSPDGRRIVYERHFDIIVMDANGGHRKRLTGGGKAETGPVFSPDGKEIAFERENEIWQMRSDGTKLRRLSPEGRYPDYSPDGRWLTFSITKNGAGSTVWLMRADGSHRRKVGPGQDSVFSADGKKLAYTGSGKATTDANVSIMRTNGSHAHHVSSGCCPSWG